MLVPVVLTLIFVVLAGAVGYFYYRYKEEQKRAEVFTPSETEAERKLEVKRILGMLARHIVLPDDEEPTVATIVNVEMLRERHPFYSKAKNGDRLIVYSSWAVIFAPERDIIVGLAQLLPKETTAMPATEQTKSPSASVSSSFRGN